MVKTLTGILVISILAFASCRKGADPGGYWTFQGSTYYVAGCDTAAGGSLIASSANANNTYTYGTIGVNFYGRLPATSGTYTVVKFPPAAGQVAITVSIDGALPIIYNSTRSNGMETVKVTTASNGFISVSGSGIEMINASGGTDSSALTFNISQTQ